MAVADVFNSKGEKVSQTELSDGIFDIRAKASVLHEVVTMQTAGKRAGSASVKHRSDVRGSTRKLFRQKGTGRARRGNIKSPLLRGGGSVFGPDPRSYAYKVPKKVRRLALKMALSDKLRQERLFVLDRLELEQIKTKVFVSILQALKSAGIGKSVLIIIDEKDEKVELSSRNIPGVKVLRSQGLNVYDILRYQNLILLQAAIGPIERRLAP